MSNLRTIQYAMHSDGYVVSRVGPDLAWPVFQFADYGKDGDFTRPIPVKLEQVAAIFCRHEYPLLRWTKKIPVAVKNEHRAFWGMKPLKG